MQYFVLGLNLLHLMKGGLAEEEVVSSRLKSSQMDDTDTLRPLEQDKIKNVMYQTFLYAPYSFLLTSNKLWMGGGWGGGSSAVMLLNCSYLS
jgi:hypothetical protein